MLIFLGIALAATLIAILIYYVSKRNSTQPNPVSNYSVNGQARHAVNKKTPVGSNTEQSAQQPSKTNEHDSTTRSVVEYAIVGGFLVIGLCVIAKLLPVVSCVALTAAVGGTYYLVTRPSRQPSSQELPPPWTPPGHEVNVTQPNNLCPQDHPNIGDVSRVEGEVQMPLLDPNQGIGVHPNSTSPHGKRPVPITDKNLPRFEGDEVGQTIFYAYGCPGCNPVGNKVNEPATPKTRTIGCHTCMVQYPIRNVVPTLKPLRSLTPEAAFAPSNLQPSEDCLPGYLTDRAAFGNAVEVCYYASH